MDDRELQRLEPLARNLLAAYLADRMGITLAYAYTRYAKDAKVGTIWLAFAAAIQEGMMAAQNEHFRRVYQDPVPGVQ